MPIVDSFCPAAVEGARYQARNSPATGLTAVNSTPNSPVYSNQIAINK